ncbi:MAG: hypothetical protein LBP59_01555 [Planctomycetaceae bacterium]|jgi:hypothetical protein|nr:hypothetical protein [Planctomycetaceae bacterium]
MASNNDRITKIQSLVKKCDWKKAYKEAKFSSKLSNDPEIKLLEITSLWNWIKDQVNRKQYDDAKINVRELIRINQNEIPTTIQNEYPTIFLLLGLNSLLPDDLKNDTTSATIQTQLIDQYIVNNIKSTDLLPETLTAANNIKEALKLIELRQDAQAIDLLATIPFQSPAAEWKLLLRGLIAHYNNDDKTATETWKRLNTTRPTNKIATNLQNLFKNKKINNNPTQQFNIFNDKSNSKQSQKIDLIDNLHIVGNCMRSKNYKEVLVRLPIIRQIAEKQNAHMYGRILRLIQIHLLKKAHPPVIRQFIEQNLPLPIDPNGNRTLAILLERLFDNAETIPSWLRKGGMHSHWIKFAEKDVDQIASFSAVMKARAKSIAFYKAACVRTALFAPNALSLDELGEELGGNDTDSFDPFSQKNRDAVVNYLTKSINADPTNLNAFTKLKSILQQLIEITNEPEKYKILLENLNKQIAEHNPNNIKLYYMLFDDNIDHNPDEAEKYIDNIEKLNPIAKNTIYRKLKFITLKCRNALLKGNLTNAKNLIEILDKIPTTDSIYHRYNLITLAFKYIFYVLSDKYYLAEDILANYKKYGLGNSLPIIVSILFETDKIKIPDIAKRNLLLQYANKINKKIVNNAAAGATADLLLGIYDGSIDSGEIKEKMLSTRYFIDAVNYIQKLKSMKWKKEKDIIAVCTLLWIILHLHMIKEINEEKNVVKKFESLIKKGKKLFPNSPQINFLYLEMFRNNYVNQILKKLNVLKFTNKNILQHIKFMNKKYRDLLLNHDKTKNPELALIISVAEERAKCSMPEVVKKMDEILGSNTTQKLLE